MPLLTVQVTNGDTKCILQIQQHQFSIYNYACNTVSRKKVNQVLFLL